MAVVINFDRRVDAELDRLFDNRTIPTRNPQCDVLPGRDFIRKAENIGDLCSVETEALSGHAIGELEGKNTHSYEVGAMDTLETLGHDRFHSEEFRSLGSPIAAGTGAVTPVRRR